MLNRLREEATICATAVQLLTRLPTPATLNHGGPQLEESVRYFSLVGVLVGLISAIVYVAGSKFFDPLIGVLLALGAGILTTGAFHEDGLADTFDGVWGGTTRERALEIMRDSRLGSYGAIGLMIILALKVAGLSGMPALLIPVVLIAGHATSRFSMVVLMATSGYVRSDGLGSSVAGGAKRGSLTLAGLVAVVALLPLTVVGSVLLAIGAIVGLAVGHIGMRAVFERRIGGYTGDCLGATQQASEVGLYLGVLACL